MITKTRAIVLRVLKYGEQKMIIDLFTESDGRVSIVTHIPKTPKGKLKKQYFQPLNLLEVELDIRPKTQLQHLRDARIAEPYASIPFDPYKLSIALFLAEFLYYSTRGEQQNEALFAYQGVVCQLPSGLHDAYEQVHRFLPLHRGLPAGRLLRYAGSLVRGSCPITCRFPRPRRFQQNQHLDAHELRVDAFVQDESRRPQPHR